MQEQKHLLADSMNSELACSANCLSNGTLIDEYQLLGVVGEGGFGIVYKAKDLRLDREVAIKEYMPAALAGRRSSRQIHVRSQHQGTFDAGLRSFINEARLLARFSHPTLVHVYRFFEAGGTAYMVMRNYEGRTLRNILDENQDRFDQARLSALLAPLLDVLEILHAEDCFHRDIAPDNIFIQSDGKPVLLDFGAARRIIGDMTQALTMVLKPGFAPIEQYVDDGAMPQGAWTDIYQIGALIYLAIVGKTPVTSVARMVSDPMRPLTSTQALGFSDSFLYGVYKALSVHPQERPQSISALRELLQIPTEIQPVSATLPLKALIPSITQAISLDLQNFENKEQIFTSEHKGDAYSIVAPGSVNNITADLIHEENRISLVVDPQKNDAHGGGIEQEVDYSQISSSEESNATRKEKHTSESALPENTEITKNALLSKHSRPWKRVALIICIVGVLAIGGISWYDNSQQQDRANTLATRDKLAWQQAQSVSSPGRLKDYLNNFPQGKYRQEADALIKQLTQNTSQTSTENPKTQDAPVAELPDSKLDTASPIAQVMPVNLPEESSPIERPKTETQTATKAAIAGKVFLRIVPWGYVSINRGQGRTSPPLTQLELPEGEYQISISNPGAPSTVVRRTIKVKNGEPVTVSHRFE